MANADWLVLIVRACFGKEARPELSSPRHAPLPAFLLCLYSIVNVLPPPCCDPECSSRASLIRTIFCFVCLCYFSVPLLSDVVIIAVFYPQVKEKKAFFVHICCTSICTRYHQPFIITSEPNLLKYIFLKNIFQSCRITTPPNIPSAFFKILNCLLCSI